ncbi:hypothetical protein MTO96_051704 [Rhipicephalus appendiculatus]
MADLVVMNDPQSEPTYETAYAALGSDGGILVGRSPRGQTRTDRLAGAAFIVLGPSERIGAVGRYRVDHATSAYCTEVVAVIEALRHVKNKGSAATVRLYTDCLSRRFPSTGLESPGRKDSLAGHSGLFGNELADFLAARAGDSSESGAPLGERTTPTPV